MAELGFQLCFAGTFVLAAAAVESIVASRSRQLHDGSVLDELGGHIDLLVFIAHELVHLLSIIRL